MQRARRFAFLMTAGSALACGRSDIFFIPDSGQSSIGTGGTAIGSGTGRGTGTGSGTGSGTGGGVTLGCLGRAASTTGAATAFCNGPLQYGGDGGAVELKAGLNPYSVVAADFNCDSHLDLAVGDFGDDSTAHLNGGVTILLGNGDGTFGAPVTVLDSPGPWTLAVGDFNLDGAPDLVASGPTSIIVFLNNGDGTFRPTATLPGGTGVAIGDFDGDGKPDLVSGSYFSGITWFRGGGDGTFDASPADSSFGGQLGVVAGDLDGDGKLDLVLIPVPWDMNGVVTTLLGRGDGTFREWVVTYLDTQGSDGAESFLSGDLNGDGRPDLVVALGNGSARVLLNNGDASFHITTSFPAGTMDYGAALGDLNGDGLLDVAFFSNNNPSPVDLSLAIGNGDGTFAPLQEFATGRNTVNGVLGDFRETGHLDIAEVSNILRMVFFEGCE